VPVVFNKPFSFVTFVPLVVFPVLMAIFLTLRRTITNEVLERHNTMTANLVSTVMNIVTNFRLFADYQKREYAMRSFDVDVKANNQAMKDSSIVLLNNGTFANWVALAFSMVWLMVGGYCVITGSGDVTLGFFLVNLNILARIGTAYSSIYAGISSMVGMFPAQKATSPWP
jgi:ABC-type bacteriocin/lantibiotic exporter with double-glycine peptidase domain